MDHCINSQSEPFILADFELLLGNNYDIWLCRHTVAPTHQLATMCVQTELPSKWEALTIHTLIELDIKNERSRLRLREHRVKG